MVDFLPLVLRSHGTIEPSNGLKERERERDRDRETEREREEKKQLVNTHIISMYMY